MSEILAAAAAALGAPEHLVERSAAARAAAEGVSADDLLATWAGGAPAPSPSAPAPSSEPAAAPAPAVSAPAPAAAVPAAAAPAAAVLSPAAVPAAAATAAPAPRRAATPVLEERLFHPLRTWTMLAGLFLLALFITLIGPYQTGGDYRHLVPDPALDSLAERGRAVYLNQGCGYCHTQLVRPVLADVGLGPATETFSDALGAAVFGSRRIGPDLAHVGGRPARGESEEPMTADRFIGLLTRPEETFPGGRHPSYAYLSQDELGALAAYLAEGLQ